jgi:hypothetical protein
MVVVVKNRVAASANNTGEKRKSAFLQEISDAVRNGTQKKYNQPLKSQSLALCTTKVLASKTLFCLSFTWK